MRVWRTTKSAPGTVKRAALLPLRYGLSPTKVRLQLQQMIASMYRLEVTPTINVTASNLERYPEIVDDLRPVDLGIHGYHHVPYSTLSSEGQARDLDRAIASFERRGFPTKGFRAPYLRTNEDTRKLLESRGFAYNSSIPRMCFRAGGTLSSRFAALARKRYGDVDSAPLFPGRVGNLIEIPVSLPDDELIVDGMGIRQASPMRRIFGSMLESTAEANSLLVLQIHPERYGYCAEAVNSLVDSAVDSGAWIAPLTEIAHWTNRQANGSMRWPSGHPFALAVTGDLDALSLHDFAPGSAGEAR